MLLAPTPRSVPSIMWEEAGDMLGQGHGVLNKELDGDPAVGLPIKTLEKHCFVAAGGIQLLPTQLCTLHRP